MKRLACSDPLCASFMSICPNSTDEHNDNEGINNPIYSGEFQSTILDGPDEDEVCVEKKRRLRLDQVKALEKNFEVENKLEPERKMKLAQEIGLQPRQVAVWFQNRRARWKTKQLERDYGVLKANYDALSHNYESLQRDNENLLKEIREIKSKLNENELKAYIKEEPLLSETEEKSKLDETHIKSDNEEDEAAIELDFENRLIFTDHFKEGFSDSDSSAILNDHESPILHHIHNRSSFSSDPNKNCYYQTQFVKIEEHNFESCSSLFTNDQAPTLHWYTSEEWN